MNLQSIAASFTSSVNPMIPIQVRANVGTTKGADGSQVPTYATPGSLTASIGGALTCTSDGSTTLTVTGVVSGSLQPTDDVSGTDGTNSILPGTTVVEQLTGAPGGIGTYQLNQAPTGPMGPCAVTSLSTVLNVAAVASGLLQVGQTLADTTDDLAIGTMITGQVGGVPGGAGTYSLTQQQTVAPETMTTSVTIYGQLQMLSGESLKHIDALGLQGSHRVLYTNLTLRGAVRAQVRGGDLLTLPSGAVYLVTQMLEPWQDTAGWVKILLTLQDGS
jgi:hypothetical protein